MPSVSKSKLLEAAQKQVAKGNLDKALKEYQKILKVDANDTGVRLKAGELHERMGDRAQALAEYRRVASTFTAQGFYSKAVAVLKRIQNADPNQIEIHLELAELNEKLGLLSEVVHHYQLAANVYDRKGEKRAAIDILKKVSEVGQSNLERKIKVAELYYKEGFPEAGYEQFVHSMADLDEQSSELVEVAIRMCKASPDDPRLIECLGSIHLKQGQPKLAIEVLERARAIAEEASTVELLAQAKLQVELRREARTLFEKAAALYETAGNKPKAREAGARATELADQAFEDSEAPAGEDPAGAVSVEEPEPEGENAGQRGEEIDVPLEELPRPDDATQGPEASEEGASGADGRRSEIEPQEEADSGSDVYEVTILPAPGPTAAPSGTVKDPGEDDLGEDERLEVAFSEAEVYRKYGKMEGAARVLEGVAKRFPHRHEPRIRLKEIYEAGNDWAKVAEQCRMLGLIAGNRGDELRSSRFLDEAKQALARLAGDPVTETPDPVRGEHETEKAVAPPEAGAAVHAPEGGDHSLPAEPEPSLDIRIDDENLDGEPPEPIPDSQEEVPADPLAAVEDMLIRPDAFGAGDSGAAEQTGDIGVSEQAEDADAPREQAEDDLLDLELVIDDQGANPAGTPLSDEMPDRTEDGPVGDPHAAETADAGAIDLRAAELLASQDRIAEAISIYSRAVDAWPRDENIRARYESLLDRLAPPGDAEGAGESAGEDAVVLLDELEEEPPSWDWVPTNGRLSTSNQVGGASHTERAPTHGDETFLAETGAEAPENDALSFAVTEPEPAGEIEPQEQSAFDLRAELAGDPDTPDEIGNVSDATEALSDLVTELQREEQEASAGLDARTHYDLGVAYKEMGLLDDAIRELSVAGRDPERRVECCEVIGVCYRMQGRPEEAVRMLEECLGDGSIAAETSPGLLYEMAMAQEAMGNLGKALDWYERVSQIDPLFGDVAERMASLRAGGGDLGAAPGDAPESPFDDDGIADIEDMLDDLETDS